MAEEMSQDQKIQDRLSQLKCGLRPEISYRLENLFPTLTGWFVNWRIKYRARLIRNLEPVLIGILHPGEEVIYVTRATQTSLADQFLMRGWLAQVLNRTALVLTNLRLILIRVNGKGVPQHAFWMIYVSELRTVYSSWMNTVVLTLEDGKKNEFMGFPYRQDRKDFSKYIEQTIQAASEVRFRPEVSQSRETLCCTCYEIVPRAEFDCESCGALYWKPSQLANRSLLLPSWGDFLMGHYMLATMELLGYVIGVLVIVVPSISMMVKNPNSLTPLIPLLVFFLFYHAADAAVTYMAASKGLNLRKAGQQVEKE